MAKEEARNTQGPWFVSGVRFKMNGGEWHSVNRHDVSLKRDENIACVGFDPRTGAGLAEARLIAAAPDLLEALRALVDKILEYERNFQLSPNPGRKYCWDATERAVEVIAKAEGRS